jgi:hypothetical protein
MGEALPRRADPQRRITRLLAQLERLGHNSAIS